MLGQDFVARDFHTNVIKSSATLKLNTSHGANAVMIFYVELDADNGGDLAAQHSTPTNLPPNHPKIHSPREGEEESEGHPTQRLRAGRFRFCFCFCLPGDRN